MSETTDSDGMGHGHSRSGREDDEEWSLVRATSISANSDGTVQQADREHESQKDSPRGRSRSSSRSRATRVSESRVTRSRRDSRDSTDSDSILESKMTKPTSSVPASRRRLSVSREDSDSSDTHGASRKRVPPRDTSPVRSRDTRPRDHSPRSPTDSRKQASRSRSRTRTRRDTHSSRSRSVSPSHRRRTPVSRRGGMYEHADQPERRMRDSSRRGGVRNSSQRGGRGGGPRTTRSRGGMYESASGPANRDGASVAHAHRSRASSRQSAAQTNDSKSTESTMSHPSQHTPGPDIPMRQSPSSRSATAKGGIYESADTSSRAKPARRPDTKSRGGMYQMSENSSSHDTRVNTAHSRSEHSGSSPVLECADSAHEQGGSVHENSEAPATTTFPRPSTSVLQQALGTTGQNTISRSLGTGDGSIQIAPELPPHLSSDSSSMLSSRAQSFFPVPTSAQHSYTMAPTQHIQVPSLHSHYTAPTQQNQAYMHHIHPTSTNGSNVNPFIAPTTQLRTQNTMISTGMSASEPVLYPNQSLPQTSLDTSQSQAGKHSASVAHVYAQSYSQRAPDTYSVRGTTNQSQYGHGSVYSEPVRAPDVHSTSGSIYSTPFQNPQSSSHHIPSSVPMTTGTHNGSLEQDLKSQSQLVLELMSQKEALKNRLETDLFSSKQVIAELRKKVFDLEKRENSSKSEPTTSGNPSEDNGGNSSGRVDLAEYKSLKVKYNDALREIERNDATMDQFGLKLREQCVYLVVSDF